MMDAMGAYKKINLVRREVEEEAPPQDTDGYSRAWQLAVTKLEEAEMWMLRAQIIEHDRMNEFDRELAEV